MKTEDFIAIEELCISHHIEQSFIHSLEENGLIQITTIEKRPFVDSRELQKIERFIEFHYELKINLEGIETINHLLEKVKLLQNENRELRNRLRFYE